MSATVESLWSELSDALRRFFERRVANPEDAADLLQESFLRIQTGLSAVRDDDRLIPWVYRIARNLLTDFYRKRAAAPPASHDAADVIAPDGGGLEQHKDRCLCRMIHELPETYRDTLLQTELEGRTQIELAREQGISVSAIKSRVRCGRRLLEGRLLSCCDFEFTREGRIADYECRRGGDAC